VRGDWNCWADPSDHDCPAPLRDWITHLDSFVVKVLLLLFLMLMRDGC
jgi:hypothetical protein